MAESLSGFNGNYLFEQHRIINNIEMLTMLGRWNTSNGYSVMPFTHLPPVEIYDDGH
jgi:hypothetical protein